MYTCTYIKLDKMFWNRSSVSIISVLRLNVLYLSRFEAVKCYTCVSKCSGQNENRINHSIIRHLFRQNIFCHSFKL